MSTKPTLNLREFFTLLDDLVSEDVPWKTIYKFLDPDKDTFSLEEAHDIIEKIKASYLEETA